MADVTINNLNPVTVAPGLVLPVSDGSSTGKISVANINSLAPVQSVAGKTGSVTLTNADVGLSNVEDKSSATIRGEITSSNVTTALGFTPYRIFLQNLYTVSGNPTSIDFTNIPSWVKRITVMWTSLSTNGTSNVILRVGNSTGFVTSGYIGGNSWSGSTLSSTVAMMIGGAAAGDSRTGTIVINNFNANTWIGTGLGTNLDSPTQIYNFVSRVNVGGVLDRVRITTLNGSDTFDSGSVNITHEG